MACLHLNQTLPLMQKLHNTEVTDTEVTQLISDYVQQLHTAEMNTGREIHTALKESGVVFCVRVCVCEMTCHGLMSHLTVNAQCSRNKLRILRKPGRDKLVIEE